VFDTENAFIYIDGTANMKTEQLDLKVTSGIERLPRVLPAFAAVCAWAVHQTERGCESGAAAVAWRGHGVPWVQRLAPAAGLLALVAPSGGEPNQCAPLLEQMRAGKAPVTVKPTK
jgi:hypothetical protein